ncbi:MAG: coniferyl aldehyde dehydrogenase [Burkholderiaceae bacterium]|nr:coniferyl aldehyde dehydrogenase [Burkholderiaceae bacterium]
MKPIEPPIDLHAALARQRADYDRAPFPEWTVRRARLQRLRALIERHETAIEDAIAADFGQRARIETQIAEVFPSLAELKCALREGRDWMKPRRASVSKWFLPASAELVPRPVGVVGIIVPWNYPLYLAVAPLAGALAAGNRALVKLSEYTPTFSALFRDLVAQTFDPVELSIVTGGPEVAAAFAALPFDHLVFTGSTAVGRKVMAAASANLTPVTLELGGKSPAVIAPGYPLARAAKRVLAGKLLNAGQTCVAPDYVLLPRASVEGFVAQAQAQARRMYPRGLADADFTSIINARQYARLAGYLDEAAAAGVPTITLFDGAARDARAHRLAPTLLLNPPPTLTAMQEEIFGPILPVIPYDDVQDAVRFINAQPRPLALYWFDHQRKRTDWALRETHVGGACVNETLLHVAQEELPFGGVGPSGMGHYHGRWGFDTMSKLTPVFKQSRLNGMEVFMPPYRPIAHKLLALMKRW